MPWIQAGGAVLGAVTGALFGGPSKTEKRAIKAQTAATQAQTEIARRQAEMAEQQYRDWYANFFPLAQESIALSRADIRPDFDAIAADNSGAFNAQRESMKRGALRYGMNPEDGAFQTTLGRIGSEEAKSGVLARNRARVDAQDKKLRNMTGTFGLGNGMIGAAGAGMAGASSGFGSASTASGKQAAAAGQRSADNATGWGNLAGSIPWGQLFGGPASTPVNSVGPLAGGYAFPPPASGAPGPWAGGVTSSKEAKYGIQDYDPNDALDVVANTPLASYAYKGSDKPMIGTIAEDAPGEISDGKQVNLVNQVGTLTGAVQALNQKIGKKGGNRKPRYGMAKPGKPGTQSKPGRQLPGGGHPFAGNPVPGQPIFGVPMTGPEGPGVVPGLNAYPGMPGDQLNYNGITDPNYGPLTEFGPGQVPTGKPVQGGQPVPDRFIADRGSPMVPPGLPRYGGGYRGGRGVGGPGARNIGDPERVARNNYGMLV